MRGNPFAEAELTPLCAAVTVAREVLRWGKGEMAVKSCVSSARTASGSGCRPLKGDGIGPDPAGDDAGSSQTPVLEAEET